MEHKNLKKKCYGAQEFKKNCYGEQELKKMLWITRI